MTKPLPSLSIFFPFYNDAGTVHQAISDAYRVGGELTNTLEVIAIHGGNSKDSTWKEILAAKKSFPTLHIIDKKDNAEGYAVIKHGFAAAQNEWVFYTDGDLQYSLSDLPKLVKAQRDTGADVVNGYKTDRGDTWLRTVTGTAYAWFTQMLFHLKIRDIDCDFRLIRRSFLKKINLGARRSSILPELIMKLQDTGASFAEIPVSHSVRPYGKSNYTVLGLFLEKMSGDIRLYFTIK